MMSDPQVLFCPMTLPMGPKHDICSSPSRMIPSVWMAAILGSAEPPCSFSHALAAAFLSRLCLCSILLYDIEMEVSWVSKTKKAIIILIYVKSIWDIQYFDLHLLSKVPRTTGWRGTQKTLLFLSLKRSWSTLGLIFPCFWNPPKHETTPLASVPVRPRFLKINFLQHCHLLASERGSRLSVCFCFSGLAHLLLSVSSFRTSSATAIVM